LSNAPQETSRDSKPIQNSTPWVFRGRLNKTKMRTENGTTSPGGRDGKEGGFFLNSMCLGAKPKCDLVLRGGGCHGARNTLFGSWLKTVNVTYLAVRRGRIYGAWSGSRTGPLPEHEILHLTMAALAEKSRDG